jgi:hypothetical protein
MITINATGDTTLHTAGKYCSEDILVKVPAGGSGGGSVEICTVNAVLKDGWFQLYAYTAYENNEVVVKSVVNPKGITTNLSLQDVVCGTALTFFYVTDVPEVQTSGGVVLVNEFNYTYIFTAPTEPNADATITFQKD